MSQGEHKVCGKKEVTVRLEGQVGRAEEAGEGTVVALADTGRNRYCC